MKLNLKKARLNRGLTLEQVAQKVSVTRSAMSMYENGKREVNYQMLLKLSSIYNVSIDYLLGNEEQSVAVTENTLGTLTDKQEKLFKMIMKLNQDCFYMVWGYVTRLLNEAVV